MKTKSPGHGDGSAARFPPEGKGSAAQIPSGLDGPVDQVEARSGPIHCQEQMALVDATPGDFRTTDQALGSLGRTRGAVLRCRCGFQMDAPYMQLPRSERAQEIIS